MKKAEIFSKNKNLILLIICVLNSLLSIAQNDGDVVQTFGPSPGLGFNESIYSVVLQSDGKILVGGHFSSYQGVTQNRIIRLNPDGTKDTTFNIGTGFNWWPAAIKIQSDGKIVVCGNYNTYQGVIQNGIIRLNQDGSKDNTFVSGNGFGTASEPYNYGLALGLQNDGKIIIGGQFGSYNGLSARSLIRVNPNGSKDTSFVGGSGFFLNITVRTIAVQPDGKILVGGTFNSYNSAAQNYILRFNSDGTKDSTFNIGTGFSNYVNSIVIQNDGKILVGGEFSTYNGTTANKLIRLNNDGTIDTSFDVGVGFSNFVKTISIQNDGKLLVGGGFLTFNGVPSKGIVRLNADGTYDSSFNVGTGFTTATGINDFVSAIAIQSNGIVLVGGIFNTYNGNTQSARLIGLHSSAPLVSENFDKTSAFSLWTNPTNETLNIDSLINIFDIKIYDSYGKLVIQSIVTKIDISSLSDGLYLVKINSESGEFKKKFIKS